MIASILLAIIAAAEVGRFYLTYKAPTKKDHFKQKLQGTQKMIYDLEFKQFKTLEIREDVRGEYDDAQSRLHAVTEQLKTANAETKPTLEDTKARLERDIERYTEQMKLLDQEVNGAKPSNEVPDGISGIKDQIDSLMALKDMLVKHIQTL